MLFEEGASEKLKREYETEIDDLVMFNVCEVMGWTITEYMNQPADKVYKLIDLLQTRKSNE